MLAIDSKDKSWRKSRGTGDSIGKRLSTVMCSIASAFAYLVCTSEIATFHQSEVHFVFEKNRDYTALETVEKRVFGIRLTSVKIVQD